jgi:hypothetical protein
MSDFLMSGLFRFVTLLVYFEQQAKKLQPLYVQWRLIKILFAFPNSL